MNTTTKIRSLAAVALSTLVACGGGDRANADSVAATDTAPSTMATGDTMTGMDRSTMPGMTRAPARDADQEFLRKMVDHHEGLIQMMDPALEKASAATAKADAKQVHDKQHEEQERMIGILKSSYDETADPHVMPNNKAMVDDLTNSAAGAAYDRKMYQHLIMHHEEGIAMMNELLPRLTNPDVKRMAEQMKADQQREIEEFRRKVSS